MANFGLIYLPKGTCFIPQYITNRMVQIMEPQRVLYRSTAHFLQGFKVAKILAYELSVHFLNMYVHI